MTQREREQRWLKRENYHSAAGLDGFGPDVVMSNTGEQTFIMKVFTGQRVSQNTSRFPYFLRSP